MRRRHPNHLNKVILILLQNRHHPLRKQQMILRLSLKSHYHQYQNLQNRQHLLGSHRHRPNLYMAPHRPQKFHHCYLAPLYLNRQRLLDADRPRPNHPI
jgi:hypothetical protein